MPRYPPHGHRGPKPDNIFGRMSRETPAKWPPQLACLGGEAARESRIPRRGRRFPGPQAVGERFRPGVADDCLRLQADGSRALSRLRPTWTTLQWLLLFIPRLLARLRLGGERAIRP